MSRIHMRFPGGRAKALTFSYDDGVEQDMRLVDIFDKHGLKGTFNINSGTYAPEGKIWPAGQVHRRMTRTQAIALFKDSPHEVAVHSLTHPFLEQLPPNLATQEVLGDRENIERDFGRITRGMAYPYGSYSDSVVEILKACGIAYSRTVGATHNFSIPTDWLRMPATCHHDDPQLMSLAEKFVSTEQTFNPWLFYVWGHSFEFDNNNNWEVIEKLADLVAFRDDIWYATNIEIYDYCKAYQSLVFSNNGKMIYNPSGIEVFFFSNWCDDPRIIYSVKPGETLRL